MITIGTFIELLSTQNVNVARYARNDERDFFCDFKTPCYATLFRYSKYELLGVIYLLLLQECGMIDNHNISKW